MNPFEKIPETKTNAEKKEALDGKWYERFEKVGSFQDVEYLEGEKKYRNEQKKEFLGEKIRNPKLDYPKLKTFDFASKEKDLLELKNDVLTKEENDGVRQAYKWKINEKIAQLRMLKAVKTGDDNKVAKYSKFIYGLPEKDIFANDLQIMKEVIKDKENSDDLRIQFAIRRLQESISFSSFEHSTVNNNFLDGKKRVLTEPFIEEKKIDAAEIKNEFEDALARLRIEGWDVVVEKDITAISVSQEKKLVRVPEKRKLSDEKLAQLIAHEIKTHVLRRENGERSKLKLLGLGLDRYLSGEEGISTFEEQRIGGADDFSGFDGHLATSLALGLDGKQRDFRDVFNILRDYFFLQSKEQDLTKAWDKAKDKAWSRCVRTFRGTSGESKGICLTRDIVYREGNINTWIVTKSNSQEECKFSLGKYDPANPRHAWILQQVGISEKDLENLE
jgi:hypothetical protein